MGELLRWQTDEGAIVVEVDDDDPGFRSVSRSADGVVYDVRQRFEEALANTRSAAQTALRIFRDQALDPDGVELEFGVKLSAAAGAVIAKTAAEGHLKVKLSWGKAGPAAVAAGEDGAEP